RMPRLDHVVLDVGAKPVLRPEDGGEPGAGQGGNPVGDVPELAVDRRRIADDSNAQLVEATRGQKSIAAQKHRHFTIIGGAPLASGRGRLIDYAPLVVSPACFARAESRSSS